MVGGREGVDAVSADAGSGEVRVDFRADRVGIGEIEEVVTTLGYRVRQSHLSGAPARRTG